MLDTLSQSASTNPRALAPESLRFADLFAGIGGFHLALHDLGATCVLAAETNPSARATYEHNFRSLEPTLFINGNFAKDVAQLDLSSVPDFDILCAGFPCQPFSIAGHRLGFKDPRGTVFDSICSAIELKRPKAYILENVPNLTRHNRGKTIQRIQAAIEEDLGYSYHIAVLRADEFGLPQFRPRTFIVGFRDSNIEYRFPAPTALKQTMSDIFGEKCDREVGFTIRVGGRGSPIDDRRNWDGYLLGNVVRRLGSPEAKKMMGFPEWFEFPVSEVTALKQLGNAVAVPVAKAVAAEVIRCLRGSSKIKRV